MKVLDLFSGIGGFSLAAHWMGWETAAFVERDKFCQRVLRKNFGEEIEIYDDITTFDGRPFRGTVDIVTGGFPCQPFSAAGKRKGRDDERHLFPQMLRVIREVGPLWVVAENVRGLLSIESGSVFAEVVASLEGEGYEVITFCVPASAVEAPHRRDRLWFVASVAECAERRTNKKIATRREQAATLARNSGRHDCDAERGRCERTPVSIPAQQQQNKDRFMSAGLCRDDPDTDDRERSGAGIGCESAHAGAGLDGRVVADAEHERCVGWCQCRADRERPGDSAAECVGDGWQERWIDVAARTCVRGMDDGIPDRVDRLKSLGNSIVPQIAFEIFRAIEAAEAER